MWASITSTVKWNCSVESDFVIKQTVSAQVDDNDDRAARSEWAVQVISAASMTSQIWITWH